MNKSKLLQIICYAYHDNSKIQKFVCLECDQKYNDKKFYDMRWAQYWISDNTFCNYCDKKINEVDY